MQSGNLNTESLRKAGLEEPDRALQMLRDLAGRGVTDEDVALLLPALIDAVVSSPDPDRALAGFAHWFGTVANPSAHLRMLLSHPVALDLFCLVTGCSQYFATLLARQPEAFEIIANPDLRDGSRSAAAYYQDLSALLDTCRHPDLQRDVLRRWKAREMLRIGVRDLIGLAEMPTTAREFSNLADACVQAALHIAKSRIIPTPSSSAPPDLTVIAMGKLGGQELNYSSDIDLMFVHPDSLPAEITLSDGRKLEPLTYLNRLAETLIKLLAEETSSGHVFRVDLRLRPEGRFGPLTRSLSSFQAYYENWAEAWERQALLKARFIAGDRAMGEAFMDLITPFVYRRSVSDTFLDEIRANKRRIEQKCALEDQTQTNVKTGYGGIRDVEFIVQLLQLEHGGALPRLRTTNTLSALQRLRRSGLLSQEDAHNLAADYIFLRKLEHRLQLLHGFQTQTIPSESDSRERLRLARRMGFAEPALFETELKNQRDRVHHCLLRLFYDISPGEATGEGRLAPEQSWSDLSALLDLIDTPAAIEQLTSRLSTAGFYDIPGALHALQLPMRGNEFGGMPPDTPLEFKAVAARLLDAAIRSADPDSALAGFETLALAVPNRAQLYAAFDDSPQMMERLAQLGGASPPLIRRIARHLEWLEALLNPEEREPEEREEGRGKREKRGHQEDNAGFLLSESAPELSARLQSAKGLEAKFEIVARFQQRETLRIGANDIWEEDDVRTTLQKLTGLADTILQALIEICSETVIERRADPALARSALSRVAVIGLGKLGGAELGYASDWDVIFLYDDRASGAPERGHNRSREAFDIAQSLVEQIIAAGTTLVARGAGIEIDLRLRPWGRKGALAHSLQGLIDYHRKDAEMWERQAALKARFVAGNRAVGRRAVRILHAVSFGRGLSREEDETVRAMKRRIESERLKSNERETDIKLGHGGLSDIEWLAQRLQLQQGRIHTGLRVTNTLSALSALSSAHRLDHAETDLLISTYELLTRIRNALWLQTGSAHDVFPSDPMRRRSLGRMMGYIDDAAREEGERLWEDVHHQMREVRRIFEQRFHPVDS